jgi:hypothetical protein
VLIIIVHVKEITKELVYKIRICEMKERMTEMSECNHNCSQCAEASECKSSAESLRCETHQMSDIKKVIAVVSGKGGVGKSLITSMLAVKAKQKGYKVGVLDADITGPSIPKIFGVNEMADGSEFEIQANMNLNGYILGPKATVDIQSANSTINGAVIANVVFKNANGNGANGEINYVPLPKEYEYGDYILEYRIIQWDR